MYTTASTTTHIASVASSNIAFHARTYPHCTVFGVLVGTSHGVTDIIPISHHWHPLTFLTDVALGLVDAYVKEHGLKIRGVYVAHADVDNVELGHVVEDVLKSIHDTYPYPLGLVLDARKKSEKEGKTPIFIPYGITAHGKDTKPVFVRLEAASMVCFSDSTQHPESSLIDLDAYLERVQHMEPTPPWLPKNAPNKLS